MDEDQDQPIKPADRQVIELADMTDEQKQIVVSGQTIAGSFPQGLSKSELIVWMKENPFADCLP